MPHPVQGRTQVALHIHGESLEWRYVQNPAATLRIFWRWLTRQLVDRPEECRQRLARARRGYHQRVLAVTDGLPGPGLRPSRLGEGSLEPGLGGRTESGQHRGAGRSHVSIVPGTADSPRQSRAGWVCGQRPQVTTGDL